MKNSLIVVTGATGFVGRCLVQKLSSSGFKVLALVRDVERARELLNAGSNTGVSFSQFDLRDKTFEFSMENAVAVIHAGAYVPKSFSNPSEALDCWSTNSWGTLRLLERAIEDGVPYFVYLSSGNAYRERQDQVKESDPLYPSAYAPYYLTSKMNGEVFVDHMGQRRLIRSAVLRPSAIYGPGMPMEALVARMVYQISCGQKLQVHDGGRYRVDLVYVHDVVQAIMRCLELQAEGIFNVGSGTSTSTFELAQELLRASGLDLTNMDLKGSPNGPRLGFSGLDISHARQQLGYHPTNLHDGLLAMLRDSAT